MKPILITTAAMLLIVACHSTKKTSSTTASTPAPAPSGPSAGPPGPPSSNTYPVPGEAELTAIHTQYDKYTTLDQLKEGHSLYTGFACTQCHSAFNFYKYQVHEWSNILDNMALRAHINPEQKYSIHQYVMASRLAKGVK